MANQLSLLTTTDSPRQRVNAERDRMMAAVAEKAERARAQFRADARAFVLAHLRAHGPTSGERVTNACKAAGIVPHDDRAFGPVYFNLAKAALIRKVGTTRRERGHGTAGGHIWALATDGDPYGA